MTPERWKHIQSLFHEALAMAPSERDPFLEARCADDTELREHVESLLAADETPDTLFEASPEDLAEATKPAEPSMAGRTVGPYRLIRELGRGGMGTVYLAERADGQFDKEVALKLVKPGMDSEEILGRFRYERQILAALEHPNIARLYDGGMDENGRPYLVMEYVEGEPIDRYCDARKLNIDQRLALFETVCHAVQFAHQNLVVHRDLKPSNILVTPAGEVKLLDFGIAKLLDESAEAGDAPRTRTGMRVMTPDYAAPEQVRGGLVTTATDVYSLGVVLYELLVGRRPLRLDRSSAAAVERTILKIEPERPSTAITGTKTDGSDESRNDASPDVADRRSSSIDQLQRRLRGDLDTIVLKALRKEPARRYASAEALAEDVRRHLSGMPVHAQPDTVGYRTKKFVARHRFGVGVAAGVFLLVVAFATLMVIQRSETIRERDRAERERDKAEEVSTFLQALFDASDPFLESGERLDTMRVRALLDRGAVRIEREMQDQPEVLAQMQRVIGDVYRNLGLYDRAEPLLLQSLEKRKALYADAHPDVAETLESLGYLAISKSDYQAAETYFRDALDIRRQLEGEGLEETASALRGLASALRGQGRYDEAQRLTEEALALQTEALGSDQLEVASTLLELGRVYQDRGNLVKAESLYRDVLQTHRSLLGDEHPQVASSIDNLAIVLRQQTKLSEAEPLTREAMMLRQRVLGPEHPQTLSSMYELASIAREQGNYDEAVELFREVIALDRKVLGDRHHYVGLDLRELGITFARMNAYDEALKAYEASLDILRDALPADHMDVSVAIVGIGHVLLQKGDLDKAEQILRAGLAMRIRTLGEDSWHTGVSKSVLGDCLMRQGRMEEAEPLLVEGYETLRDGQGPTETALQRLVAFYETTGDETEAARYRALKDAPGT